jgi:hypothetical protein
LLTSIIINQSAAKFYMTPQQLKIPLLAILLFTLPLKLSISYAAMIPAGLLWLWCSHRRLKQLILETLPVSGPLITLVVFATFSSVFGFDPLESVFKILRFSISALTILLVYDWSKREYCLPLLVVMILGQSVAAFHTIISSAFPFWPDMLIGAVSESGQLALIIPICLGMILSMTEFSSPNQKQPKYSYWSLAAILLLLTALLGFAPDFQLSHLSTSLLLLILLLVLSYCCARIRHDCRKFGLTSSQASLRTVLLLTPVLVGALLINLKRGPWAGVLIASIVLFIAASKRTLVILTIVLTVVFLCLGPVRHRLEQTSNHFRITGGRQAIWQVGWELASRYPLGIGFNNSPALHKYDPQIGKDMSHFHNNFLNILVETGWIGLGIFLWWLISCIRLAFQGKTPKQFRLLGYGLGCAFISWQVAGVVEYNFGDSEVRYIAFVVLGLLCRVANEASSSAHDLEGPSV